MNKPESHAEKHIRLRRELKAAQLRVIRLKSELALLDARPAPCPPADHRQS